MEEMTTRVKELWELRMAEEERERIEAAVVEAQTGSGCDRCHQWESGRSKGEGEELGCKKWGKGLPARGGQPRKNSGRP